MSDDTQANANSWSSVQVYVMAVVCLVAGIAVGYLFRGVAASPVARPTAVAEPSTAPTAPPMDAKGAQTPVTPQQLGQMGDKKVAPLLEEIQKNPRDSEAMLKAGSIYFATRQFDKATEYFEKSAQVKPTPDALTKLSNAYYYAGSPDKAINTLNQALKLDPNYANALFNLGMLKWQSQSDAKGAIECWQKLLRTNPNHPNRAMVEQAIARAKQHPKMSAGKADVEPAKM
jgi:cytochrome c-type biogenesis protein CcmH/NrfG